VQLVGLGGNRTNQVLREVKVMVGTLDKVAGMVRVEVANTAPYGRSQVRVTAMDREGRMVVGPMFSSFLTKAEPGQLVVALLTIIVVSIILGGAVFCVYRRCQVVAEAAAMEPRDLVAEGRMEEQTVLIITTLDNPQHVEIVKRFCRYLRDWCGVGTTYFALSDDESGIGGGDPWKWCQETGDSVRQNGNIVFIAGPNRGLSSNPSIHPNLEQNQAFLTTSHLHTMAIEGRAFVLKFAYSHLGTLPQEVPDHLKLSAYSLPRQLNEFLLQLLKVRKQSLCRLALLPLVQPRIRPADLSREGGTKLLDKVKMLTATSLAATGPRKELILTSVWAGREREGKEEMQTLLSPSHPRQGEGQTLTLELEGNMPSTRDMGGRDNLDTEDQ